MGKSKEGVLTFFSIIVIILSLLSFGRFTGKVSDSSVINVSVISVANINFTSDRISFGSGSVNIGESFAIVDSIGNVSYGNWTPTYGGFMIENIGNTDLFINLKTNKDAQEFLGGTNPEYKFNVTNIEGNSCYGSGFSLGEWYEVNTTADGTLICENFSASNSRDSIRVDVRLKIPYDASIGNKTSTFTATGTAI
jgi:hypothetical protein